MVEPLNRDEVIGLLNSLGSDRDEDVLAAAREVHAKRTAAGLSWQDLLRPEGGAEDTGDSGTGEDAPDTDLAEEPDLEEEPELEQKTDAPPAPSAETDAESLTLIEELLAKTGISADLREELTDYKSDIAEGEFGEDDRKYLRAMHGRLSKRK